MDDKDFVFVSKPSSDKQEQSFRDFLKSWKLKTKKKRQTKKDKQPANFTMK